MHCTENRCEPTHTKHTCSTQSCAHVVATCVAGRRHRQQDSAGIQGTLQTCAHVCDTTNLGPSHGRCTLLPHTKHPAPNPCAADIPLCPHVTICNFTVNNTTQYMQMRPHCQQHLSVKNTAIKQAGSVALLSNKRCSILKRALRRPAGCLATPHPAALECMQVCRYTCMHTCSGRKTMFSLIMSSMVLPQQHGSTVHRSKASSSS